MDKYLVEAIDNYPYDLKQTVESLDYALSSNPNCPHALVLKGRIYAEQMMRYDKAIQYYEEALCEDVRLAFIYPHYIYALQRLGKHREAKVAIDYALKLPELSKAWLLHDQMISLELTEQLDEASEALKTSLKTLY